MSMTPVTNEEIHNSLQQQFTEATIQVDGDGYQYHVTVISPVFASLNKVKRHQKVYASLQSLIGSGRLHAVNIDALTPEESSALQTKQSEV